MDLSSSSGSVSGRTIRDIHLSTIDTSIGVSQPSSPRSSALPSPPDSPDSISSFPSLSSSFFFSSAAASPPHTHGHVEQDRELTQGLIIPSLTLPAALRQPTPYGKTIGDLRILAFGSADSGASSIANILLEANEDIVDVGPSELIRHGLVTRASTDWVEHRDAHGLEKFEPTHNVEVLDVSKLVSAGETDEAIARILSIIHEPFQDVLDIIDPACPPSALLSNLLSSQSSPLYTALVIIFPSLSPRDRTIIDGLGAHIPIILLSSIGSSRSRLPVSAFRPSSTHALRSGFFHSPETLNLLRSEAADRFLRWREIERAVHTVHESRTDAQSKRGAAWDKAVWETEWDATLSRDVARRLREGTVTCSTSYVHAKNAPCTSVVLDPFHIPSLVMFSLSLFTPWKDSITQMGLSGRRLGIVLVGTLCAGVGIGLALRVRC
ncbi:hypothetical protein B0F90DRAFT_1701360 [Multifurca ochricompacta]|uniref:Uncharacterized protein n=1 Tax=Multifurca ochricompacta TaxID=376703 RepID=A0AAD4M9J5_9AGAM|nr:hypothetical protein B0F90DRAFT_1701360 [Multifurca ochricompacta]